MIFTEITDFWRIWPKCPILEAKYPLKSLCRVEKWLHERIFLIGKLLCFWLNPRETIKWVEITISYGKLRWVGTGVREGGRTQLVWLLTSQPKNLWYVSYKPWKYFPSTFAHGSTPHSNKRVKSWAHMVRILFIWDIFPRQPLTTVVLHQGQTCQEC